MTLEHQVVVIYAVTNGYLDKFKPNELGEIEPKLHEYMANFGTEVLAEIKKSGDLSEATEKKLKEILQQFVESVTI